MSSIATRIEVAKAVGLPLIEAEKLLDQAMTLLAQVQIAAVQGRRDARLPLTAGHGAIAKVISASQALMDSRQAVHEAHYEFRSIADGMQVPARAYGDHGDTPRENVIPVIPGNAGAHLSVVQADAA